MLARRARPSGPSLVARRAYVQGGYPPVGREWDFRPPLPVSGDGRVGTGDVNEFGHGGGTDWTAPKFGAIVLGGIFLWWTQIQYCMFMGQDLIGKASPHKVLG